MDNIAVSFYIQASSSQPGALGIFQVYAPEQVLIQHLDLVIGSKHGHTMSGALSKNEIRYGWLQDSCGSVVDEVMLACPDVGVRILMTHGGKMIAAAVRAYFADAGFLHIADWTRCIPAVDRLEFIPYAPILASCITETQIAAVLESDEAAVFSENPDLINLLVVHRIVLAGPPNAGKSSLLNCLAGYDRAFVHEKAGATRDAVDELVDLGGFAVMLGDLPGFNSDAEILDRHAWEMAVKRLRLAEALFFICDRSRGWDRATDEAAIAVAATLTQEIPVLIVLNKADLPLAMNNAPWLRYFPKAASVAVCSLPNGDAKEVMDKAIYYLLTSRSI